MAAQSPKKDRINIKHIMFVNEFLKTNNVVNSYATVFGVSPAKCLKNATRLFKKDHIQEMLQEARTNIITEISITKSDIVAELLQIKNENASPLIKMKSLDMICKILGFYQSETNLANSNKVIIDIDLDKPNDKIIEIDG